jgi:hypothetical protein
VDVHAHPLALERWNTVASRDVPLDISGNEFAIAAYSALESDKVVVVANAPETRFDLCPLLTATRVRTPGHCERLLGVFQAQGFLWAMARTTLCRRVPCAVWSGLQPFELLPGFGDSLVGRPLFGGHGPGDRFDELVLHREQVG